MARAGHGSAKLGSLVDNLVKNVRKEIQEEVLDESETKTHPLLKTLVFYATLAWDRIFFYLYL